MEQLSAGIMVFDGVEVLDFAGPFEVLSRARLIPGVESRRSDDGAPFSVFTVAAAQGVVTATGGLRILPHHDFASAPQIDILLIPGGFGTRSLLEDEAVLDWVRDRAGQAQHVASICTGSLVLAAAGLLRGRRATTHWGALDLLERLDATIQVDRERRVVGDEILTSAGVSAGIDMAFTLVERICGRAVAQETAHYIEYPWPTA